MHVMNIITYFLYSLKIVVIERTVYHNLRIFPIFLRVKIIIIIIITVDLIL